VADIFRAGQFELQTARIISASGKEVDVTLSTISITIFEDITQFAISGDIVIQDSVNLGSLFPLVGQEYLLLKLATASITGKNQIVDFTKNALSVTKISARVDIGNGVQAYNISFTSRELVVDQRVRVNQSLKGSSSDIVKQIFKSNIGTKKTLNIEPSADNRKIVSPNKRPFELIGDIARSAVSRLDNDPCYICFETTKGFNFRTLASIYAQPSAIEYTEFIEGTKTPKGAVNLVADFSNLLQHNIVSTQDTIYANRAGAYASKLYVHDIVSKSYRKYTYNYIDNFDRESHIESTNGRFRGETVKDFPIVSDLTITKDRKRISDFPARTFVQPSSGLGADNSHVDDFGQNLFTSNSPERSIQRRSSQIEQLRMGYTVQIKVNGNTAISAGDIVDINLPYTASTKTSKNEKFDNIYQGKFLIYKLRHDFNVVGKEHFMFIEAVKDSLKTKLPSSENPEIIDEGEQKVNESFYGES